MVHAYLSSSIAVKQSTTRRLKTLRLGSVSRGRSARAWMRRQSPHWRDIRITSLAGSLAQATGTGRTSEVGGGVKEAPAIFSAIP
jgi:hypothetical protein